MDAFRDAWTDRAVVLVEGSDLVRADLAGRFASDEQRATLRTQALHSTDRLVGRLLDEVDPKRDAVIVVGPVPSSERPSLTPVAVRATGFAPGLLRSTTTRKDGFVNMVDVAPTILHLYGLDRPESMEGRQMESAASNDTLPTRVSYLVNANEDGLFRDSQVGPSLTTVLVIACVLAVGGVLLDWLRTRTPKWARRGAWPLTVLALGLVGFLDATYLAGPLHFGRHGGAAPYWLFVVGVAVLLTAIFIAVGHLISVRVRRRALLVHTLLVALVEHHRAPRRRSRHRRQPRMEHGVRVLADDRHPVRRRGQHHLLATRRGRGAVRRACSCGTCPHASGTRVAVGVLAVTIVVMGVPAWGNDFGAVLSALPGFALLGWMLLGHRVRARTVAAIAGIVVAAVVAVGLLDLLRPPDQRTHVGKFFQKVGTDFHGATLVIRRKADANLSVLGHSVLLGTIIATALLVAYLWYVHPRTLRAVAASIPTAGATALAFLVVAVLGFGLNDSGIAIPGMMFAVFESAVVVLVGATYLERVPSGDP